MRKLLAAMSAVFLAGASIVQAEDPPPPRELLVPFEDLHLVFQHPDQQRVLLSQDEFQALMKKAKVEEDAKAPTGAVLFRADYTITVQDERATFKGSLGLRVLEAGLHALPLDLNNVGLQKVTMDNAGAAVGRDDKGQLRLFVAGKGEHQIKLEAVAPIQTTAARQILNFKLPQPGASSFRLTIPGDVEIKSGAAVVSRVFDAEKAETRFELLVAREGVSLVMSLNSRLKRQERAVVARTVLVDEVTTAYERINATISLDVLHRSVNDFRFRLPAGFDITEVSSPNLARWEVSEDILTVFMRDEATGRVVVNLSGLKIGPDLAAWTMPHLEPLDVIGHVAVIGMMAEERLEARNIEAEQLIAIDNAILMQAIPQTFLTPDPGAARVRSVKSYYAPQGGYNLSASFERPESRLFVTSNVLLLVSEDELSARGHFTLQPLQEKVFAVDVNVPEDWELLTVTGDAGTLAHERYENRVHVRLPQGIAAGALGTVYFTARHVPSGWFDDWETREFTLPVFSVAGAQKDIGAVLIDGAEPLKTRAISVEGLTPLDENDKTRFGVSGSPVDLAYRYESPGFGAQLAVERITPRMTAEVYSFYKVQRESMAVRYELIYSVEQARVDAVEFVLPNNTPESLSIVGLNGVVVKEYAAVPGTSNRVWKAHLTEPQADLVHLAVDFQWPVAEASVSLPVPTALHVAYQSGLVAIEGSQELDVTITAHPRPVDVGELVEAEYLPGRRLLGVFGYVGDQADLAIEVAEHPGYALPPALIERAEMVTALSADGVSQSSVRFLLRSSAIYLEIRLPESSELWSAMLDGEPIKPQQDQNSLLLELATGKRNDLRDLQVVYETPVTKLGYKKRVGLDAPRMFLHEAAGAAPREVPVTDLKWRMYLPEGYEVIDAAGNVVTESIEPPATAVTQVGELLYRMSGGIEPGNGLVGLVLSPVMFSSNSARSRYDRKGGYSNQEQTVDYAQTTAELSEEMEMDEPVQPREQTASTRSSLKPMPATPPAVGQPVAPNTYPVDALALQAQQPMAGESSPNNVTYYDVTASMPVPVQTGNTEGLMDERESADAPFGVTAENKKKNLKRDWAMQGLSSLKINLQAVGNAVEFTSLGEQPRLDVEIAHEKRRGALVWAIAVAVLVLGIAKTGERAGHKARFVLAVLVIASIVPAIPGLVGWAEGMNAAFYAACCLVPYYLLMVPVLKIWRYTRRVPSPMGTAAATMVAGFFLCFAPVSEVDAQEKSAVPYIPVPQPLTVPADAVVVPYNVNSTNLPDRVLVPYERYRALYDLANPDEARDATPPPVKFALAGAEYTASLAEDEYLTLKGVLDVDVFVDDFVEIPFMLQGGVFAEALLDGESARIKIVQPAPVQTQAIQQKAQQERAVAPPVSLLYVKGKGRHTLQVAIRLKLSKQGGWRVVEGVLPHAPATAVLVTIPDVGTELRMSGVLDRPFHKSTVVNEQLATTLGDNGTVSLQWRPKISEGEVDRTLTVQSQGAFDVQEDHVRLTWDLQLDFRRGEREVFDVQVPADYLVEKVEGLNVRGWELETVGQVQQVKVRLLKRIKLNERFTVHLRKSIAGKGDADLGVPYVEVADAIRHTGRLLVRRSPYLRLHTINASGLNRSNLGVKEDDALLAQVTSESPLGIRDYEAYEFVAVPFTAQLERSVIQPSVTADTKAILRMGRRERNVEARIDFTIQHRPLYNMQISVPADLEIEGVQAPVPIEWEVADAGEGRQLLNVHFSGGILGSHPLLLLGPLGEEVEQDEIDLPDLEIIGADRQEGHWVIQTDPGYDVQAKDLDGLESVLPNRVHSWLLGRHRELARTVLRFKEAGYRGRVALTPRKPIVRVYTVTNTRITDRAIEETIMLNFTIEKAGVRELQFRMPSYLADASIDVPLLRQKTVEPVADNPEQVLVTLTLQDEVIDQLRVLVEHDRLLEEKTFSVAIPEVVTGRTERRYVARESAGRDEVVTESVVGLDPLTRQMKEWATVAPLFKGGTAEAWIVRPGAEEVKLTLSTRQRSRVETAGATIGLAQTVVMMDSAGTYRGQQTYHVDNRTEQFLEIRLPNGAALWTAQVANEFVKPILPDAAASGTLKIPLVKTAEGDLDFKVVLKYGGKEKPLSSLGSLNVPIIETVNINVELSQAEVHLPQTHRWYDFGGTMRREQEAGQLQAGELGYLNKQAKQLVQTLQYGDQFSKARAYNNWGKLKEDLSRNRDANVPLYSGNMKLNDEAQKAAAIFSEAEEQLRLNGELDGSDLDGLDNRGNFNEAFSVQNFMCADNMVNTLGNNFSFIAPANQAETTNAIGFNNAWFLANGLDNAGVDQGAGEIGGRYVNPNIQNVQQLDAAGMAQQLGQTFNMNDASIALNFNTVQQQAAPNQAAVQAQFGDYQSKGKKVVTRRGQKELAFKYQQRLEEGQNKQEVAQGQDGQQVDPTAFYAYPGAPVNGDSNGEVSLPVSGVSRVGVGAGLASLDVRLPNADASRWAVYEFTTPRGEVKITARAVGTQWLDTCKRLGVLAVVLLVYLLLIQLFRDRSLNAQGRRILSTVLILAGVAGLLVGVLPLAALVALVAGIVLKVSGRFKAARA